MGFGVGSDRGEKIMHDFVIFPVFGNFLCEVIKRIKMIKSLRNLIFFP